MIASLGVRLDEVWTRLAVLWWALLGGGWLLLECVTSGIRAGMEGPAANVQSVAMELPFDAGQAAGPALIAAVVLVWPWLFALRAARPRSPMVVRLAVLGGIWGVLAIWIGSRPLMTYGFAVSEPATCETLALRPPPLFVDDRIRSRCEHHRAHNLAALGGASLLGLGWLGLAWRTCRRED